MKFLYKPLKPFFLGQKFGTENTDPSLRPLYDTFGLKGHNGLDIGAWRGQPVSCACDGTVSYVETTPGSGLAVEVISPVGDRFYKHVYGHLQGYNVVKGQVVAVGDLLGWADSTGASTGDHLHFGLKECTKEGKTLNYKNGYKGAIDPLPFLFDGHAVDAAPLLKRLKGIIAQLSEQLAELLRK